MEECSIRPVRHGWCCNHVATAPPEPERPLHEPLWIAHVYVCGDTIEIKYMRLVPVLYLNAIKSWCNQLTHLVPLGWPIFIVAKILIHLAATGARHAAGCEAGEKIDGRDTVETYILSEDVRVPVLNSYRR
jgi:hypothetical protein